jgi:hypothetical protein
MARPWFRRRALAAAFSLTSAAGAARGAEPPAAVECAPAAAPAPCTWHGHKHPTQPLAPPGAFPVPPTGAGYYNLRQLVEGTPGEKPPRWPYQRSGIVMPSYAEFDFSYLDPLTHDERDWAERLKRRPLGEHWLFSTGGEFRYRYNDEANSQLGGKHNNYNLYRTRAYGDLWYEDSFRLFGEFLYADITGQDLPPLVRDVNRGDVLNLFADVRLFESGGNPAYLRFGQQELLYGSQRLLSTNEWGNNRVRFQAVKAFYRSPKWDADVFTGRPVQVRFNDLDPGDHDLWFTGAWLTHKPRPNAFLDLYYLNLDNTTPGAAAGRFRTGKFNLSTLGARTTGRGDRGFLWDVEAAVQFGGWADQHVLAEMVSTYLGWNFKDAPLNPTVWVGHDYASGDPDPNATGTRRTFNQLFAFGHYYLGFLDYVGRQNVHDFSVQAYCFPMKWLTAGVQYHAFRLAEKKDALYNAFGRPVRQDRTGVAGTDVGQEIDVVFNAHLTDRQDVFVQYAYFFPGAFVRATGPARAGEAVYVQYSWRW